MDDTARSGSAPQQPSRSFADRVKDLAPGGPPVAAQQRPGVRQRFEFEISGGTFARFKAVVNELLSTVSGLAEEALAAAAGYYESTGPSGPALAAAIGSRPTADVEPEFRRQFVNITVDTAARIDAVAASTGTVPSAVVTEAFIACATWYEDQLNDGREFPPLRPLPARPRPATSGN